MSETWIIGHFPPPLHGQALATERLAQTAESLGKHVVRFDTSATSTHRSFRYLVARLGRNLQVAFKLVASRKTELDVHIGVDADAGLPLTLAVGLAGVAAGHGVTLHHHSFRYMHEARRVAAVGFRVLGKRARHVVSCQNMADALRTSYGANLRCEVVSVGFAIAADPVSSRQLSDRPNVVGTLSNLGRNKGLDLVIEVFDSLSGDYQLSLGGPASDNEAETWINQARQRHTDRLTHHGRVDGEAKADFLAGLDVFLFPSRHQDESFGLVVLEALRVGVPVLMVANPCFGQTELGDGGHEFGLENFAQDAVRQIDSWAKDPVEYRFAQEAARRVGQEHLRAAAGAVASLWPNETKAST